MSHKILSFEKKSYDVNIRKENNMTTENSKLKKTNNISTLVGKQQTSDNTNNHSKYVKGFRNIDEEPYKGIVSEGPFIPTGFLSIDMEINDLGPEMLTVLTGRSNGGKSTVARKIITNAIDKNYRVLYVFGESTAEKFLNKLYLGIIGNNENFYDKKKNNRIYVKEPKERVLKKLQEWHKNKLYTFDKRFSNLKTNDDFFDFLNVETKKREFDLVVIDNLMSVLHVNGASNINQAQAEFTRRCVDLAKSAKNHVVLVAHPNKSAKKGEDMEMEQVSGSSDIYNAADIVISVVRNYKKKLLKNGIDGKGQLLKNREESGLLDTNFHFDKSRTLYFEIIAGDIIDNNGKEYKKGNCYEEKLKIVEKLKEMEKKD